MAKKNNKKNKINPKDKKYYPTKKKDLKTVNNPRGTNTKTQQKLYKKLGKAGNKARNKARKQGKNW